MSAPSSAGEHFLVSRWTVADGLPHNRINVLAQDRTGYLWIGTPCGLVRFDGSRFVLWNRWSVSEQQQDRIQSLLEEDGNRFWVGTTGGGLKLLSSLFNREETIMERLAEERINAMTRDSGGELWIGTDRGLYRMSGETERLYTVSDGLTDNRISALEWGGDGNLWIGTRRGGVARYSEGVFYPVMTEGPFRTLEIFSLCQDGKGRVWAGTDQGILEIGPEHPGSGILKQTFAGDEVTALALDADSALWVGTRRGLWLWNLERREALPGPSGLSGDEIRSLFTDREKGVWAGTAARGLVRFQRSRIKNIPVFNRENVPGVSAVLEDSRGVVWAGGEGGGITRIEDGRVCEYTGPENGAVPFPVRCMWEDRDGAVWAGTDGGGIYRLSGHATGRITDDSDRIPLRIFSLIQDRNGSWWIGSESGLIHYRPGETPSFKVPSGIPSGPVFALLECGRDSVFAGTSEGVFLIRGNETVKLPLPGNPEITDLYEGISGELFIGTRENGLIRWDGKEAVRYGMREGLADNAVLSISGDGLDNLWLGSYRGVFRVAIPELEAFVRDRGEKIHPVVYDEKSGMDSRHCSGTGHPAVWKTRDGMLLFATLQGISCFDPRRLVVEGQSPPVILEEILADNLSVTDRKRVRFSSSNHVVEFRFTLIDFVSPEKIHILYRLEGLETEWHRVDPGRVRQAIYINLKPGPYTFRVGGADHAGNWNRQGDSFQFTVGPSLYQRVWFRAAALGAILAGAIAGLLTARRQRKTRIKYKTSALSPELAESAVPRLEKLMEEEKPFLNPDLTLRDLAKMLHLHPNYLSQIINERIGVSYNDYVNRYRIEEAKKRLIDSDGGIRNVLEIALDTGFYSKSVFNSAFKKFTGMTPSQYRKKHL
jgi:ligand-binding sensor domain-containing protein/AraC-like DNA-binding protein